MRRRDEIREHRERDTFGGYEWGDPVVLYNDYRPRPQLRLVVPSDDLVTVREARALVGLSESAFRGWISKYGLRVEKDGRVHESEVAAAERRNGEVRESAAHICKELEWFRDGGVSPELTVQELHVTAEAAQRAARRQGRSDLAAWVGPVVVREREAHAARRRAWTGKEAA